MPNSLLFCHQKSRYPQLVRLLWLLADWSLAAIHLVVVVANLSLWIPKATRRFHLLLVGVTAASWFGLGMLYGWGYCVLTDLHWAVKRELGEERLPHSFIHHVLVDVLGAPLSPSAVDSLTTWGFALAVVLSVVLNGRDLLIARQSRHDDNANGASSQKRHS